MTTPLFIDRAFIEENTNYPKLINTLDEAFRSNRIKTPDRNHYNYESNQESSDSTLLIMPAWENQLDVGIKLITVNSDNPLEGRPSIQGLYILINAKTGVPEVIIDAPALTNKRTAGASALASRYLSREDTSTLLMIGTGQLIPDLISAHCSIRPIKNVLIWGRSYFKAKELVKKIDYLDIDIKAIEHLNQALPKADLISSATTAIDPIIFGRSIFAGQHIDLVGSFKPSMREADDALIQKASIYVDTVEMAPKESGDLFIPLENGILTLNKIKGDLFDLCSANIGARKNQEEITLFKSVGLALEDLAAARYYYDKFKSNV